jgi:hypothetical protein
MRPTRLCRYVALTIAVVLPLAAAVDAGAENREVARRRATERKTFTDAQIVDGFFKITFGAELDLAGTTDRIRKFEQPVRVLVANEAKPDRRAQIVPIIADIKARVRHLDIAIVEDRGAANMAVTLVRNRDLAAAIRRLHGRARADEIMRKLDPQCLSGFGKDESSRILRAEVILVVDRGEFVFLDCAYEEILQGLGPINDVDTIPWTMFNDNVQMGFFGVYDQHILNLLYDPRIRAGMTAAEVRALMPQVLPDVRAWVAKINGPAR